MELTSTTTPSLRTSWSEAVLRGLAPDGGLYIPLNLPVLSPERLAALREVPFAELAFDIAQDFLGDEIAADTLRALCVDAFPFDAPLRTIAQDTFVLELFHGPTCAFKDFGARFMAGLFRYFLGKSVDHLTVLVATSGDTGSAVANAFFDPDPRAPISVTILFPKGKVTPVQEKQMTTLGHNVTAYEVEGTFDDCQALVKRALADTQLTARCRLTSANSINIARLLPQSLYYIRAMAQLDPDAKPIIAVPSGNLGNLTGGLMAQLMGARAFRWIAACNRNAPFPTYLRSGVYAPHPSYETISNAMDVGNPSNFARIVSLFGKDPRELRDLIIGESVSDPDTRAEIRRVFEGTGYVVCPHTAVGFAAARRHAEDISPRTPLIVAGTADAAKFAATVEPEIGRAVEYPSSLAEVMNKKSEKVSIPNSYPEFLRHLLAQRN